MGVGGHKFVGAGAKVRRCVEEGAMRWGRAYGCRWAKVRRRGAGVRCGGSVRMGVEGRKFVGAGAGVRRCVEEGALRRGRAYGCGRAQVRRRGAGVRCVGGIGAEECGERCAAVGRFLSRNEGKAGGDGRTAIDKMARRCAAVGALVRRSVRKGVLRCGRKYALMQAGVRGRRGVTISSQLCNSRVIAIG